MKIDKSQDPLIAVIRLQVPALNFDWSHKFVDGDKIKLQSFPLEIDGFEGVTVSLQLSLKKLSTSGHTVVAYKVFCLNLLFLLAHEFIGRKYY